MTRFMDLNRWPDEWDIELPVLALPVINFEFNHKPIWEEEIAEWKAEHLAMPVLSTKKIVSFITI